MGAIVFRAPGGLVLLSGLHQRKYAVDRGQDGTELLQPGLLSMSAVRGQVDVCRRRGCRRWASGMLVPSIARDTLCFGLHAGPRALVPSPLPPLSPSLSLSLSLLLPPDLSPLSPLSTLFFCGMPRLPVADDTVVLTRLFVRDAGEEGGSFALVCGHCQWNSTSIGLVGDKADIEKRIAERQTGPYAGQFSSLIDRYARLRGSLGLCRLTSGLHALDPRSLQWEPMPVAVCLSCSCQKIWSRSIFHTSRYQLLAKEDVRKQELQKQTASQAAHRKGRGLYTKYAAYKREGTKITKSKLKEKLRDRANKRYVRYPGVNLSI